MLLVSDHLEVLACFTSCLVEAVVTCIVASAECCTCMDLCGNNCYVCECRMEGVQHEVCVATLLAGGRFRTR